MRIVIIGAGNAGRHLAATLCKLNHDVVLIDERAEPLSDAEANLDILTIEGQGSSPSVLDKAEISKADLVVAVTNRDEVNILACAYAHACGVPRKVARVSNPDYTHRKSRLDLKKFGLDLVVSHKQECAREIFNILRMPGTLEVVDLLERQVQTVGLKVSTESPMIRTRLRDFPRPELLETVRFIALVRGEELLIPNGDTQLLIGDDVYLIIKPEQVREFMDWAYPEHPKFDKVIIGGGGDLGLHLAQRLEETDLEIVLLEANEDRADYCSALLNRTLVMKADLMQSESLSNAGIEERTAFVAVTGDDENNIISCLLAEKQGASFTIAQVTKPSYVPVINGLSLLDRAVSPHLALTNAILHFLRGRDVLHASLLHNLPGELLEIQLPPGSRWAGKPIRDLNMPDGSIIAVVQRNGSVFPATGNLDLQAGDRVVVFTLPKAVERLQHLFRK
jgi:trk system potassium uptake protein TrkA